MYKNLYKQIELAELRNDVPKNCDSSLPNLNAKFMDDSKKLKKNDGFQLGEENSSDISVKTFFNFMKIAYQPDENIQSRVAKSTEMGQNFAKRHEDFELPAKNDEKKQDSKSDSSKSQSFRHNTNDVEKSKSLTLIKTNKFEEIFYPKIIKKCLSDILHNGLVDTNLPPLMVPKSANAQSVLKKTSSFENKKFLPQDCKIDTKTAVNKDRDKRQSKKPITDNEVEIHVCDEAKNIKKDFRCPQRLLVQKMCYFAEVTAGQKLEEMDISVHCDIAIFDWLMRWVKKDIIKKSEWPILEPSNVIPIMVSASFLQMQPLLDNCLTYCHANMSEILKTSSILTCLNETLLTRLANQFSNVDIENLKDKKDKIQSRLFCKLIMALTNPNPDFSRGHFGSLATLFKCGKCGKNIIRSVSELVPCESSNMKIDTKGDIYSKHARDLSWNLNDYIFYLRSELRYWRKVYWRLWGDCHFLFCKHCGIYFPVNQMNWCSYHPENPQFFVNDQQKSSNFPLGRYPCCSQRAYRFQVLANRDGCKFHEHVPKISSQLEENIVNVFLAYRDIISLEPPQIFYPEKITRLVSRDPQVSPGKILCKETFWWDGIEIIPPRPKLGLLGRIWGACSPYKPCDLPSQRSKKIKRQISQSTDISSLTSTTETDSDEDDEQSYDYKSGSCDDESLGSEDSQDYELTASKSRKKKKSKFSNPRKYEGMGSWNSSLSIRNNQDNQREFEEKTTLQMISLLTKRTLLEYNLNPKNYSSGRSWINNTQPAGGTYVKLEAEFREQQQAATTKTKNTLPTKTSLKTKPK